MSSMVKPTLVGVVPFSRVLCEYLAFLRNVRGLCKSTIRTKRGCICRFLCFARKQGISRIRDLRIDTVQRFIVMEGHRKARKTMSCIAADLCGFLQRLHHQGLIRRDLSVAVIRPRIYRHENCPRYLTRAEVELVLSRTDRRGVVGRRDYAILLLLSSYGLRAGEVAKIELDDIDWHHRVLHVRQRKAGNNTAYPLDVDVGNAIVNYLKRGRRLVVHRHLFTGISHPFGPLTSRMISSIATQRTRAAGLTHVPGGAHVFRYSCAQRLFEADQELKVIGDFLGHRNLDTTRRYIKIDLSHLREVALNDGEAMSWSG